MSKIAFSDLAIRNLPAPERGQSRYWDASLSGFGLRVSQGGSKTFVVLDPRAKVRTQETIGRYPIISLAEARAEAKRRLAEATLGKHRPRSMRWNAAVVEFVMEKKRKRRARTASGYERLLRHFNFGETKLDEVSAHDIQKRLDKLASTPSEEQHTFVAARVFLRWAHRKHYIAENPIGRMQAPHSYVPRERILTDEEFGKVWRACGDDAYGRIVKILMLTGQRVGEVTKLSSNMIRTDSVTLPAWLAKNNREHTFPLLPAAKSLMPSASGKLFPSPCSPDKYFSNFGGSKARLDKASGVTGWTLHDLRRTLATGLASQGVSLPVVERLLNHVSGSFGGIVGVYQRYDFMPEMRAALEKWEAHVLEVSRCRDDTLAA